MPRNHIFSHSLLIGLITVGNLVAQSLPTTTSPPVAYSNTMAVFAIDTAKVKIPPRLQQIDNVAVANFAKGVQGEIDRMKKVSDAHTA